LRRSAKARSPLQLASRIPSVVLMTGLQGSARRRAARKLGRWLAKDGHLPLMVSTDVNRPAAREQLRHARKAGGRAVHHPAELEQPRAILDSALASRARSATTSCSWTPRAGCTSTTS
jgi:signal recognition particle subunit SRP54